MSQRRRGGLKLRRRARDSHRFRHLSYLETDVKHHHARHINRYLVSHETVEAGTVHRQRVFSGREEDERVGTCRGRDCFGFLLSRSIGQDYTGPWHDSSRRVLDDASHSPGRLGERNARGKKPRRGQHKHQNAKSIHFEEPPYSFSHPSLQSAFSFGFSGQLGVYTQHLPFELGLKRSKTRGQTFCICTAPTPGSSTFARAHYIRCFRWQSNRRESNALGNRIEPDESPVSAG